MAHQIRLKKRIYYWHVTVFAAGLGLLLSHLLSLELGRTAGTVFAHQPACPSNGQGEKDVRPLEEGKPIERELSGGQVHYYKIALEAGQYLSLVVDQKGIDVIVTLSGPTGKKMIEVDSLNGWYGPESVSMIADISSTYVLEVRSIEKDSQA